MKKYKVNVNGTAYEITLEVVDEKRSLPRLPHPLPHPLPPPLPPLLLRRLPLRLLPVPRR